MIDLGVAGQKELTDNFNSLTKQRRQVFGNPDGLDSLGIDQAHIELIPPTKNRSKKPEISVIPVAGEESPAPEKMLQNGYG